MNAWYGDVVPVVRYQYLPYHTTIRPTRNNNRDDSFGWDTDDEWEIYLFSLFFAQIFLNGSFLLILPYKIFLDDM